MHIYSACACVVAYCACAFVVGLLAVVTFEPAIRKIAMEANQILDRVLTRWCNLHLPQEYQVEGLGGFEDEGTLVYLLEKVSSKKIGSSGAKRRMSFSKVS